MVIVLREKDAGTSGFGCRDGEIEFTTAYAGEGIDDEGGIPSGGDGGTISEEEKRELETTTGYGIMFSLEATGDYPEVNIRVPLESGDSDKVALMLQGNIGRVDAASAERISQKIVRKAAEEFSQMLIDHRRMGQYMLPFRVYGKIETREVEMHYPSAQAVMLPSDTPPHPEITASSVHDDTLTLSVRFTAKPHRLRVTAPSGLKEGERVTTYVSYPLYIPKSEDITGTLGSVRSASGGNAIGIRFSFLTTGRMKHSVAAPEKYYKLTGNENTGYHMAEKAEAEPDYREYAARYGQVFPFPAGSMLQTGSICDPLEWIGDWEKSEEGYLPKSLPYIYRSVEKGSVIMPEGIETAYVESLVKATGCRNMLLTRPMAFCEAEKSRRKAERRGVKSMRIYGLPECECVAVLLGSDDGVGYGALRVWDPHTSMQLHTPKRMWHRLLLLSKGKFGEMAIEI